MSQSRARKPSAPVNGAGARSREIKDSNRVTNASGDTANGQKVKGDKPSQRGKSSNKIPKSMRYDLENALVGVNNLRATAKSQSYCKTLTNNNQTLSCHLTTALNKKLCDIWFEEIKPHLVKNKIKLHVHGGSSGDHEDSPMPPGAPGCSHLDPATSSARCKLCQLLLNASSSIQSAVSQAAFAVPVACSSANNRDKKQLKRRRQRGLRRAFIRPPQYNWRVPRLCRTYSLLPSANDSISLRRTHTVQPLNVDTTNHRRKLDTINKYTQTPVISKPQRVQLVTPRKGLQLKSLERKPQDNAKWLRAQTVVLRSNFKASALESPAKSPRSSKEPTWKQRKPSPKRKPASTNATDCIFSKYVEAKPEHEERNPLKLTSKRGVKVFSNNLPLKRTNQRQLKNFDEPLFKDDLIGIITERHDKKLKMLYENSARDEDPSILNLVPSPHISRPSTKKYRPWR